MKSTGHNSSCLTRHVKRTHYNVTGLHLAALTRAAYAQDVTLERRGFLRPLEERVRWFLLGPIAERYSAKCCRTFAAI